MLVSLIRDRITALEAEDAVLQQSRQQLAKLLVELEPFEKKVVELCHVSNGHVTVPASPARTGLVLGQIIRNALMEDLQLGKTLNKKRMQGVFREQSNDDNHLRHSIQDAIQSMATEGLLKRGRHPGIYVCVALPNHVPATEPEPEPVTSNGCGIGGKGGKRNPATFIAVRNGLQKSLRDMIKEFLTANSYQRYSSREIAKAVKAAGYKTTSSNFDNVCCSMLNKMYLDD